MLVELQDKPGQLKEVTNIIADLGGNVTTVHHERSNSGLDINGCYLRVELETRNHEHINKIREGLKNFGFKLID